MNAALDRYAAIIKTHEIMTWDIQPTSSRLNAKIVFIDDSCLIVKDYLFLRDGTTRKYAYHWQDRFGRMKARWDNAAHWKQIATFPHHKHEGQEDRVVSSRDVSLDDVMHEIASCLQDASRMDDCASSAD